MAENKPVKKSQRVSLSKLKLAETASELQDVANAAAITGRQEAVSGAERLETAGDMAAAGAVLLAKGASDLTKAEDAKLMSDRMGVLSDVVTVAGVTDIAEGAEMLAASKDVSVMSALVGMMTVDDLQHGLELARLSGELDTVGEMVEALKMPVLAIFLSERAARLHEMSVEQIRLAISTDGVSQILAAAGKRITALGENEVEEGMARLAVSKAAAEKSAAMAKASEDLTFQGIEQIVVAGEVAQAARIEAFEGAAELSSGSAVVGAAVTMDEVATALKEKSN